MSVSMRAGVTVLALVLGLILGSVAFGADGNPVPIGVVIPLEGPGYQGGIDTKHAVEIAVDGLNAAGGVGGRKVQIVARDSKGDVQTAARLTQELVEKEHVAAVFGGGASSLVLAMSAVVKQAKVPYYSNMGNSETIVTTQGHDYVFLMAPSSGMEARAFAAYAKQRGWKRFAAIAPDYEWGHSVVKLFGDKLKADGVDAVIEPNWFKLGSTDFSPYITKLQSAKADAILVYAWGSDIVAFTKQAKLYGLAKKGTPMAGFWMFDALLPLGAESPEGAIGFERAPFTYLTGKFPAAKKFTDEFKKRTGSYPSGYALMAYDSVQAWAKAVAIAGDVEPVKVAKAMKGLTYSGTRGDVTIRAIDGQAAVPVYFGTVTFDKALGLPAYKDVVEIKASDVWMSEADVLASRKK
jgi:branched-chain amino acid transport system substrate-binding protein